MPISQQRRDPIQNAEALFIAQITIFMPLHDHGNLIQMPIEHRRAIHARAACDLGRHGTIGRLARHPRDQYARQTFQRTAIHLQCRIGRNCIFEERHILDTTEQRIVDTEGQVDRFYKKLQAREQYLEEQEARKSARTSPDRPIEELGLGTRATDSLTKAGINIVGDALEKLAEGESALLAVDGFGRKSLADLKKRLRQFGYELPEAADEIVV